MQNSVPSRSSRETESTARWASLTTLSSKTCSTWTARCPNHSDWGWASTTTRSGPGARRWRERRVDTLSMSTTWSTSGLGQRRNLKDLLEENDLEVNLSLTTVRSWERRCREYDRISQVGDIPETGKSRRPGVECRLLKILILHQIFSSQQEEQFILHYP